MTEKAEKVVVVIRETALQSLVSDAGSFVTIVALIGIGWFLDSQAMQWVGAVLGFAAIIAQGQRKYMRMSVADARKRLDEIEAAQRG